MESNNGSLTINERRHEEVDFMAYMPIEILVHIFSFLPLKFWVLMSLVSKRWKDFWTQSPILELNESEIVKSILKRDPYCSLCNEHHNYYGHDHDCHLHLRKEATKNFFSVVDRILLLHSGCPITRFSLFIDYDNLIEYTFRIDTWVDFAMRSKIESLELNFSGGRIIPTNSRRLFLNLDIFALYRFKNSSFAPKMVKNLTLIGCVFDVYAFATLNSLQRLSLFDVDISGWRIGELLFKCPLLEALKLKRCLFFKDFMICEEELKIRELHLIDCMSYSTTEFPISIVTPSLTTLTLVGQHLTSSSIKKSTNLVNVVVEIRYRNPHCMTALLTDLRHCQFLELNSWCIQVLRKIGDSHLMQIPLEFQNLRNLRLRIKMFKKELSGLAYLISCCPNLETLNLDINQGPQIAWSGSGQLTVSSIERESYWESQPFSFQCLQNSLKKVNINGFLGRKVEMHFMKFLLESAMVLEELNLIHLRPTNEVSNEHKLMYMGRMLHNNGLMTNFIKASPDARIKVSY